MIDEMLSEQHRQARPAVSVLALFLALIAFFMLSAQRTQAGTAVGTPLPFPSPVYLTSIACVNADTCYVAGRTSLDAGPSELFTLTDGSLTNQQAITVSGANFVENLACQSNGTCYAIGSAAPGSRPVFVLPILGGIPQQVQTVDGVASLNGIACSNQGGCYAVGVSPAPNSLGVIVPILSGQVGQPEPVAGVSLLRDIDCPGAAACYAIGSTDTDASMLVPVAGGQPGPAQPIDGSGLRAIACPSADICYAVGYAGLPASTNRGQGTGGFVAIVDGQPGSIQPDGDAGPFGAIACPTSRTCFALSSLHAPSQNSSTFSQPGAVVPISDGTAGAVIAAGSGALISGDCPTSQMCYAVTQTGVVPIVVGAAVALPVPRAPTLRTIPLASTR